MLIDQALLWDPDQSKFYVSVDSRGRPTTVTGFQAVAQQLTMMILVGLGEFPPDPNLGSDVIQLAGSGGSDSSHTAFLYKEIEEVIEKLRDVQASYSQIMELEDYEMIEGLVSIDIMDSTDPRFLDVVVTVLTKDDINRTFSVPVQSR